MTHKPYKILLSEYKPLAKPKAALTSNDNGTLTLYCYDVIGEDIFGDGFTSQAVASLLETETFDNITLRLDSPGGSPFVAMAIYNLLKGTGKPVTVIVDGLAASAASLLAMVGDKILMGEGSMFMIHEAWTVTAGNAAELRKTADDVEKISSTMADVYAKRTGLSVEEVQSIMAAETWLSAEEAIDNGFATGMVEHPAPAPGRNTSAYLTRLQAELATL